MLCFAVNAVSDAESLAKLINECIADVHADAICTLSVPSDVCIEFLTIPFELDEPKHTTIYLISPSEDFFYTTFLNSKFMAEMLKRGSHHSLDLDMLVTSFMARGLGLTFLVQNAKATPDYTALTDEAQLLTEQTAWAQDLLGIPVEEILNNYVDQLIATAQWS